MKNLWLAILSVMALLMGGCASVPMASMEDDKKAKSFVVEPDKSNIYVYRNESFGGAIAMPVSLDGKVAGKTGPKTYFHWVVEPGQHEISSLTENTSKLTINAEAGKSHYVWQEVKMGMWAARSKLQKVSEEEGQKGVLECKMIKSEL